MTSLLLSLIYFISECSHSYSPVGPQQVQADQIKVKDQEMWQMQFQQHPPQGFVSFPPNFANKDLFDEMNDEFKDQKKPGNPFRKVSGLDQIQPQAEVVPEEDPQNKFQPQFYYQQPTQFWLPFQMAQFPMVKMIPQYKQYVPPAAAAAFYQPYIQEPISLNTVSKELQTKVYMIVSQTTVSHFQCNCKKSKCLKMYCECFASGQVCSQMCNCLECKNRIDNPHERQKAIEEALIRNNDAFNNLLINKQGVEKDNFKPQAKPDVIAFVSDCWEKGCNCKKSNCKKKYCECFNAGLMCEDICKCENCSNKGNSDEVQQQQQQQQQQQSIDSSKNILFVNSRMNENDAKQEEQNNEEQKKLSQNIDIDIKHISSKSKKIKKIAVVDDSDQSGSEMKIQIKNTWTKNKKT